MLISGHLDQSGRASGPPPAPIPTSTQVLSTARQPLARPSQWLTRCGLQQSTLFEVRDPPIEARVSQ